MFDLLGARLNVRDFHVLSQVSRGVRDTVYELSEEIFSRHYLVQKVNRHVVLCPNPHVPCTHYSVDSGPNPLMRIPLPHGVSSRGKLRAVVEYMSYWRTSAVCVHVGVGDTREWLFATDVFVRRMAAERMPPLRRI